MKTQRSALLNAKTNQSKSKNLIFIENRIVLKQPCPKVAFWGVFGTRI
jgi:hypothetical protein